MRKTKKHRRHDDDAWRHAKTVCRLTSRQVEMARALGMNPKKLPGLRPSPQQRWKAPVGKFIEELYKKRFGGKDSRDEPRDSRTRRRAPRAAREPVGTIDTMRDHSEQILSLVCYCVNLADDLEEWVQHGPVDTDVLPQIAGELRETAAALENGAAILEMPGIPRPPAQRRAAPPRSRCQEHVWEDDEIPF